MHTMLSYSLHLLLSTKVLSLGGLKIGQYMNSSNISHCGQFDPMMIVNFSIGDVIVKIHSIASLHQQVNLRVWSCSSSSRLGKLLSVPNQRCVQLCRRMQEQ